MNLTIYYALKLTIGHKSNEKRDGLGRYKMGPREDGAPLLYDVTKL